MKLATICFIVTILIGASNGIPCFKLDKCFSKTKLVLISKPCFPSLLSIKQFHFGTPCGRAPHICTCCKNIQRPEPQKPQLQHSTSGEHCDCKSESVCTCGPQIEEKDINIKLRFLVPKLRSIHPY